MSEGRSDPAKNMSLSLANVDNVVFDILIYKGKKEIMSTGVFSQNYVRGHSVCVVNSVEPQL